MWAACVFMIVENGNLTCIAREGSRQLTTWIHISEENAGDRCSGFRTREPGIEDGWYIFIFPAQDQRTSGENHKHNRLASGNKRSEKSLLGFGNVRD